jgi:hypothetical protein
MRRLLLSLTASLLIFAAMTLAMPSSAMAQSINVMESPIRGSFIIYGTNLGNCMVRLKLPYNGNGPVYEYANTTPDRWGKLFEWQPHYACMPGEGKLRVVVVACPQEVVLWDHKTLDNVCFPGSPALHAAKPKRQKHP